MSIYVVIDIFLEIFFRCQPKKTFLTFKVQFTHVTCQEDTKIFENFYSHPDEIYDEIMTVKI